LKASIDKTPSSIFEESKNNEIAETGTPNYLPESLVMDFAKRSPGNITYPAFVSSASSDDFFSLARKNLTPWLVVQSEPPKEEL